MAAEGTPEVVTKPWATLNDFNAYIRKAGLGHNRSAMKDNPGYVEDLAVAFYKCNEDPKTSPNLEIEDPDDYSFLMDCLDDPIAFDDDGLAIALLKVLKVLSRKVSNRETMEMTDVRIVVKFLHGSRSIATLTEAASICLNICYEKEVVGMMVQTSGVDLLADMMSSYSEEVQANAAGALQSLSYQEEGRVHMREQETIKDILPLLTHDNVKVRTRVVGVVHNMSSDVQTIAVIREAGAIKTLVRMLSDPVVAICSSAAGAIQNISREGASKVEISDCGGVPPLIDLMFGSDVQTQVCATGALLNILGPKLESDPGTGVQMPHNVANRKALSKLVMLSLVTGVLEPSLNRIHKSSSSAIPHPQPARKRS